MKKIALKLLLLSNIAFANPLISNFDASNIGTTKDVKELERLAQSNPYLSDINYMLGIYYMAGDLEKKLPPDFKKAMDYLQKDKENIAIANYKIAELYYYGYGVEKDYQKAIEYFKRASDKKFKDHKSVAPIALLALSQVYIEKLYEYDNAVPYLMQAAQDFDKVEAQMILAFLYYEGKGIEQNEDDANFWINKAYFNKAATGDHKAYISNFIEPSTDFNIQQDVKNYCGVLK